jgi:hypothetical protein
MHANVQIYIDKNDQRHWIDGTSILVTVLPPHQPVAVRRQDFQSSTGHVQIMQQAVSECAGDIAHVAVSCIQLCRLYTYSLYVHDIDYM